MGSPAEEKLTEAIDNAIAQYYQDTDDEGMPGGWVLLINDLSVIGSESGINIAYPHGDMPWTNALGIVEAGRIHMHATFANGQGGRTL
jgi:hypothetical protein